MQPLVEHRYKSKGSWRTWNDTKLSRVNRWQYCCFNTFSMTMPSAIFDKVDVREIGLRSLIKSQIVGALGKGGTSASFHTRGTLHSIINPLTPVPPITACDEHWPFFLFWCHHFWPKLASAILNFCRRKRSFQWCPDQSDWPNGALDMHKKDKKVEWKTQSKISCHYTWLLHAKNCLSWWRFLGSFLTASKPSRRSLTPEQRKEKEKKKRRRKKCKSRKA